MPVYTVFNGDADGLCALQQLRLQQPEEARHWQLVTGVKRDIGLLATLGPVRRARIMVLDLSLDRNRTALQELLAAENRVLYIDHHYAGEIPDSPLLEAHIDPSPRTCTALLVDRLLNGSFSPWAVVGAFGDDLHAPAMKRARELGLDQETCDRLQELGTLLNYNSYGESALDLHVHPLELCAEMQPYPDPLHYLHSSALLPLIQKGYETDQRHLQKDSIYEQSAGGRVFFLPNAAWARRIAGTLANRCAGEEPTKAHAILQQQDNGSLRVSVRAPLHRPEGADLLCRSFAGGGGRSAAAGINSLPPQELTRFLELFRHHFPAPAHATSPLS